MEESHSVPRRAGARSDHPSAPQPAAFAAGAPCGAPPPAQSSEQRAHHALSVLKVNCPKPGEVSNRFRKHPKLEPPTGILAHEVIPEFMPLNSLSHALLRSRHKTSSSEAKNKWRTRAPHHDLRASEEQKTHTRKTKLAHQRVEEMTNTQQTARTFKSQEANTRQDLLKLDKAGSWFIAWFLLQSLCVNPKAAVWFILFLWAQDSHPQKNSLLFWGVQDTNPQSSPTRASHAARPLASLSRLGRLLGAARSRQGGAQPLLVAAQGLAKSLWSKAGSQSWNWKNPWGGVILSSTVALLQVPGREGVQSSMGRFQRNTSANSHRPGPGWPIESRTPAFGLSWPARYRHVAKRRGGPFQKFTPSMTGQGMTSMGTNCSAQSKAEETQASGLQPWSQGRVRENRGLRLRDASQTKVGKSQGQFRIGLQSYKRISAANPAPSNRQTCRSLKKPMWQEGNKLLTMCSKLVSGMPGVWYQAHCNDRSAADTRERCPPLSGTSLLQGGWRINPRLGHVEQRQKQGLVPSALTSAKRLAKSRVIWPKLVVGGGFLLSHLRRLFLRPLLSVLSTSPGPRLAGALR